MTKQKILTDEEAFRKMTDAIDNVFEDRLYEFVHSLMLEAESYMETNYDISPLEECLDSSECWYDSLRDDVTEYIVDKIYNIMKGDALDKNTNLTSYVHLGYYNDVADIKALSRKSADEILDYYKEGLGNFYEDDAREPDTELIKEDEQDAIARGDVKFTSDEKYAIYDSSADNFTEIYKDSEDGDDSDSFIDIYELRGQ